MAHQDVFEESKLKIKVKLKERSKKSDDTAKLILKVDGVDEPPISLRVKKQWVEHEHKFKKVPDDKDSYPFEYRIEYDGENKAGETTCTVWPRDVNIKLFHVVSGEAAKDLHFDLRFGASESGHYKSDDAGLAKCKIKHHGMIRMVQSDRLRMHGWKPGKGVGRNREALVEVIRYEAVLESPAWDGQDIEQYVNLASANNGDTLGHDKQGRKITFNLRLRAPNSPTPDAVTANNERIYVKATLTELTKRDAELATLEDVSDPNRKKDVLTGYVSTRDGKASFTLCLGLGGKEKCKLQIGTTDECKDITVNFENLRKLWVQSIAAAGRAAALDDAKGGLKKVGIELLDDTTIDVDPTTLPAGSTIPGACLGEGSDVFIVGDHNVSSVRALFTNEHTPLSAYAIFCDYQFDGGAAEMTLTSRFTFDQNATEWVGMVDPDEDEMVLSHSLHTGLFAVSGKWKSLAAAGDHAGKKGALAEADFMVDAVNRPGQVQITLPAAAAAILTDGEEVKVTCTAVWVEGDFNGWAPSAPDDGGVVIALKNIGAPRDVSGMNQTVVHELGHLINMVKDPVAGVGLTLSKDHGRNYVGRGHLGGHCGEGINAVTFALGGDLDGKKGTCVMFGQANDARKGEFCNRCKPFVLGNTLEAL